MKILRGRMLLVAKYVVRLSHLLNRGDSLTTHFAKQVTASILGDIVSENKQLT